MKKRSLRIEKPNYTMIPNVIFDDLMANMSEPELRVVLTVCRKTFGWQKNKDIISLTQIEKMSGLSRPAVVKGVKQAEARGIIERDKNGLSFDYQIAVIDENGSARTGLAAVNDVNQQAKNTSKQGLPELVNDVNQKARKLVNDVNTQKKVLKERKEMDGAKDAPCPPAVQVFREVRKSYPPKETWDMIGGTIGTLDGDLSFWKDVLIGWVAMGWNPRNVTGALDFFQRREIPHNGSGRGKKGAGFIENIQAGFDRYEELKNGEGNHNQESAARVLGALPTTSTRPEPTGISDSGLG